ncbi:hypothetical protein F5Y16DRAFT_402384 [Xylariaceae sp. FL0255]|nr:hypothetical protein F5Y16DRAFT_402384 [Xylariaceae sp. FL0255]
MKDSMRYHKVPEIPEEDHFSEIGELERRSGTVCHRNVLPHLYAFIIGVLVVSNITFYTLWIKSMSDDSSRQASECVRPQLIYSPATSSIRYEKKRLWRDIDGPNHFTGKPRPELDSAWEELIGPLVIKVSGDELNHFSEGDTSIAFKDGSGFLAEMGAYHELHCVRRVRRYLNLDHYYPNMTAADRIIEDTHMDHCLEYWRQSVMCRGDTTLATLFFREDGLATSRVYTDNECIDWQALDNWARKRKVDMSDYTQFISDT